MTMRDSLGTIWPNTTWMGVFTWTREDAPVQLATEQFTVNVRIGQAGRTALIVTDNIDGEVTVNDDGEITVVLTPAETVLLVNSSVRTMSFDIDAVTLAGNIVSPLVRATVEIGDMVVGQ